MNQGFADAQRVDASFERLPGTFQGLGVKRLPRHRIGLENDLETSLEVKSLANRVRGPEAVDVVVRAGECNPCGEDRQQDDADKRNPGSRPQARTPRKSQRVNARKTTQPT